MRSRAQGFTLIELLVVIAIVGILAAMLFPVLHAVRQKAWETTCTSNVRQLGMAVEMYLQDHDEVLPVSYVASPGDARPSWREAVQPYLRDRNVLVCPAAEHRGPKADELPPELRATYALNAWLSPPDLTALGGSRGEPLTVGAVADPAATILLCDAGYSNVPVALDLDHYLTLGMQEQVLPTPRHHDAANFGFVDGHVKKMTEPATRVPEYLWDPQ